MKKLILVLLFALPCWGTAYNTQQTGPWNTASTWTTGACGTNTAPAVPATGDTVTICAGHTVTMAANNTIGTGGATGTAAITLNTGTLVTNAGTVLTAKGDIQFQLGATLTFNGSVSFDTPAATVYKIIRIAGGAGTSTVTLGPASGTRATFQTITTQSTSTDFRIDGVTTGGFNLVIQNAIINQCGGLSNRCIDATVGTSQPNCTFTNVLINNSGEVRCTGTGSGVTVQTKSHVDFRNNTSNSGFVLADLNTTAMTGGQRSWDNITAYNTGTNVLSCTMLSCQWGNSSAATAGGLAAGTLGGHLYDASFSWSKNAAVQNLFILNDSVGTMAAPQTRTGVVFDNNVMLTHMSNPHYTYVSTDALVGQDTFTNNIMDGDRCGSSGSCSTDTGDFYGDVSGAGTCDAKIANNVFLNEAGTMFTVANTCQILTVRNNTVYQSDAGALGESAANSASALTLFRDNLFALPTSNSPIAAHNAGLYGDTTFARLTTGVNVIDYNGFWAMPGSGEGGAPSCSQPNCTLPNGTLGTSTSYMMLVGKSSTVLTTTAGTDTTHIVCTTCLGTTQVGDYVYNATHTGVARITAVPDTSHATLATAITGQTTGDSFQVRLSYSATTTDTYGTTAGYGTHDVHTDPQFHDPTVTLCKWYLLVNGSGNACPDATTGNLVALAKQLVLLNGYDFQGNAGSYNSNFNIASAKGYIRSGFMPQTVALRAAGSPTDSSPDIGALSVGSIRHRSQ